MPSSFLSRTMSAIFSISVLLVHLIGDRRDDERLAVLADVLDMHLGAHDDRAAAFVIGRQYAAAAEDQAAGREVRPLHDLAQFIDGDLGIVEVGHAGVDDFAQVVRRDVGRHADRDAAGAVDEQVRELGRQDRRLHQAVVVVGLEVDGFLVEVVEQRDGDFGQPRLRCSARRPAGRHRPSRSCPGHRRAARASRSPARGARARRRSRGCRADGSRPSLRRRPWPT